MGAGRIRLTQLQMYKKFDLPNIFGKKKQKKSKICFYTSQNNESVFVSKFQKQISRKNRWIFIAFFASTRLIELRNGVEIVFFQSKNGENINIFISLFL